MKAAPLVVLAACGSPVRSPRVAPIAQPQPQVPRPSADGSIGTPHPVLLQEVAEDGSWLVICQARKDTDRDGTIEVGVGFHGNVWGDAMRPYVVFGSGDGVEIERLVTRDQDDKQLVYVRGGRLYLSDATGHATALRDADVRDDAVPSAEARPATMTADGTRMLYFRHGKKDQIVIREIASGSERIVDVDHPIWRASIALDGHWARIAAMRRGASFPIAQTDEAGGACHGRALASSDAGLAGDPPIELWLDVDHGAFVAPTKVPGDVREDIGRRPHHGRREIAAKLASAVYCAETCTDGATGKKIALPKGRVVDSYGAFVLIEAKAGLIVFDAVVKTATPFPGKGKILAWNDELVTVEDGTYDLTTLKKVAEAGDRVFALVTDKVLVGKRAQPCTPKPGGMPYACVDGVANLAAGGHSGLPNGPLRWIAH